MTSSVFQGLQSCLEPGEASTEPNVAWLKLVRHDCNPISQINNPKNEKDDSDPKTNRKNEMNEWSFIRNLPSNKNSQDNVYVHPLTKSSTSLLSKKSLEMCTESLGSETGTEVIDMSSLETTRKNAPEKITTRNRMATTRRTKNFPPPITTISGGDIKVMSHREGGRLLLQAVNVAPLQSCFHAERSEGRLKLSLIEKS